MKLDKLKQQQAAIAEQIAKAEAIEKNKLRVHKLIERLLAKHPTLYLADAKKLEEHLIQSFAAIAQKMGSVA